MASATALAFIFNLKIQPTVKNYFLNVICTRRFFYKSLLVADIVRSITRSDKMSCVRTVKTFEVVEIKLDEIKANDLVKLEETLCNIMIQKLEKLNVLIKETNIYNK